MYLHLIKVAICLAIALSLLSCFAGHSEDHRSNASSTFNELKYDTFFIKKIVSRTISNDKASEWSSVTNKSILNKFRVGLLLDSMRLNFIGREHPVYKILSFVGDPQFEEDSTMLIEFNCLNVQDESDWSRVQLRFFRNENITLDELSTRGEMVYLLNKQE